MGMGSSGGGGGGGYVTQYNFLNASAPTTAIGISNLTAYSGQTFLTVNSGTSIRVTAYLKSTIPAAFNYYLTLFATTAGVPSGTALATSAPYSAASLTTGYLSYQMEITGTTINNATTYWVGLYGPGYSVTQGVQTRAENTNVYANGAVYSSLTAPPTTINTTADMAWDIEVG